MNRAHSASTADRRARLAILLVAIWLGLVLSAFFGLAVWPRLALPEQVDEADFVLVAEAWWRDRAFPAKRPVLVLLPGCACTADAGRALLDEAPALGVEVRAVDAASAPQWGLTSKLPAAAMIDTLLFDRDGRLQMAFLRSNPDHCLSAAGRLRGALSSESARRVWPGWCPCDALSRILRKPPGPTAARQYQEGDHHAAS